MSLNLDGEVLTSPTLKQTLVFVVLTILVLTAFWQRQDAFIHSPAFTIDEVVYYRMGMQVKENWRDYHTIPYANELSARGRSLPQYFFQPLYKHPPVFTFLIALSLKLFKPIPLSGAYVSILFGVLMIPLTYCLGRLVFDWKISLTAAFLVFLDPVSIMSSQKIWPDTTLAFFMVLTLFFFVLALRKEKLYYFLPSGLSLGVAVLVKYPGILPLAAILLFVSIYRADLFKTRIFWLSFFGLPFVLLFPWGWWNLKVYGLASVARHAEINAFLKNVFGPSVPLIIILGAGVWYLLHKRFSAASAKNQRYHPTTQRKKLGLWMRFLVLIMLAVFFADSVIASLRFEHIPLCSWSMGYFKHHPWYFYISRLTEYSFLYFLGFAYLFTYHPSEPTHLRSGLRLFLLVVVLFFSAWGNYQSRYILAAIPVLALFGIRYWVEVFVCLRDCQRPWLAVPAWLIWMGLLIMLVARTFHINLWLSYTNNMCYF